MPEFVLVEFGGQILYDIRLEGADVVNRVAADRRIVDDRSLGSDFPGVPGDRLIVKGREHVDDVDVRPDFLLAQPDLKITVLTLDVRIILPLSKNVESTLGSGLGKDVRRSVDSAPLRTSYHP